MKPAWQHIDTFDISLETQELVKLLRARGIDVDVRIVSSQQQFWVNSHEQEARQVIECWLADADSEPVRIAHTVSLTRVLHRYPVTFLLLVLSVIGAALVNIGLASHLYYSPLYDLVENNQWWRLLTPTFLHFGLSHLLFNLLALVYFGTVIEKQKGPLRFGVYCLAIAILANIAQFAWAERVEFGGLSGVVYGMIGYLMAYRLSRPIPIAIFNPLFLASVLLWLVSGLVGLLEMWGVRVANGAHLGGWVAGLILGGLVGLKDKRYYDKHLRQ